MSFLNCFLVFSILIWVSITEDFDVTDTNGVTPSNVNGIFFDLKPKRHVRIKSFTFTKGGNPAVHNVSIYIKIFPGTFVGYENDPSVWQLWHTYQFNSTKAKTTKTGTFDRLFMIYDEDITSFFIVFPSGGQIEVTNDNARPVVSSNDFAIFTGKGVNNIVNEDPFSHNLVNNRNFIGIIEYDDLGCHGSVLVDSDGGYTLRTKRTGNGRIDRIQCFIIDEDYECNNPIMDVVYASIDYDSNDEWLRITSNYLSGPDGKYDDVYCSGGTINQCDTYLTCLDRYQDNRTLYSNTTFMVRFRNGPQNHQQHCTHNELEGKFEDVVGMDVYMTLTCGCDAFVELDATGTFSANVVVEGATGGGVYRDVCFNVDNSFTCYEPNVTVIYEDIDYDPNDANKYLNVKYMYDNISIDLGNFNSASETRECGSYITAVDQYYLGDTIDKINHGYRIRLTHGPTAGNDEYCYDNITNSTGDIIGFDPWVMNVTVIVECTEPTPSPTPAPSQSPTNYTVNASNSYSISCLIPIISIIIVALFNH